MIFHTPFYITTLPRREKKLQIFLRCFFTTKPDPCHHEVLSLRTDQAHLRHRQTDRDRRAISDRQTETEEQSQTDRDRRAISDRQTETEEQSQ